MIKNTVGSLKSCSSESQIFSAITSSGESAMAAVGNGGDVFRNGEMESKIYTILLV